MTHPQPSKSFLNTGLFWSACLASILLFIRFYPPIYAFRDEGIYLSLAQVFKAGTVYIEKTGIPMSIYVDLKGHHLPFYPPGHPLLLIPFILFGLNSAFTMGLCFHLAGTFLFKKLTEIFDCDHPVAWLSYLFFPSFVFYSRTLMSDIPSLTIFLAAFYFYFKPQASKTWAGFFFGLSLLFRVSNAVVILPFFAGLCLKGWREKNGEECIRFCAAAAPFAAAAAIYNTFIYGSPFLSGYSEIFTGVKNFSVTYLSKNTRHYLMSLNTVYPFMMLLFLCSRRIARMETIALTGILFAFFGFYYFQDRYPQPVLGLVFGNRFFYPVIPFFIMAFAQQLQTLLKKIPSAFQTGFVLCFALFLFTGSAGIHKKHQGYLLQQAAARDVLYQNTREGDTLIYDGTSSELIQAAWGKRNYLLFETYPKMQETLNNLPPQSDIYVVIRKTYHGTTAVSGALALALKTIQKSYQLHLAAESNGITLYKLTLQEGDHALS